MTATSSRIITISQATSEMRLTKPVTNASGMVLMPEGVRLTPIFIDRLKKWGVQTLEITSDTEASDIPVAAPAVGFAASPVDDAGRKAFAEELARDVARRFGTVATIPIMAQLRAIVGKQLFEHGPNGMLNRMRPLPGAKAKDGMAHGH